MATYVILSRISPGAFADPRGFRQLAEAVAQAIKLECPGVKWRVSFATTGRFDAVDIVDSDDLTQVERAAMIIRSIGRSSTETLVATPWEKFVAAL